MVVLNIKLRILVFFSFINRLAIIAMEKPLNKELITIICEAILFRYSGVNSIIFDFNWGKGKGFLIIFRVLFILIKLKKVTYKNINIKNYSY